MVLKGLAVYAGRGFLTEEGATVREDSKRKPTSAKQRYGSSPQETDIHFHGESSPDNWHKRQLLRIEY
jgi:hypothetical protein